MQDGDLICIHYCGLSSVSHSCTLRFPLTIVQVDNLAWMEPNSTRVTQLTLSLYSFRLLRPHRLFPSVRHLIYLYSVKSRSNVSRERWYPAPVLNTWTCYLQDTYYTFTFEVLSSTPVTELLMLCHTLHCYEQFQYYPVQRTRFWTPAFSTWLRHISALHQLYTFDSGVLSSTCIYIIHRSHECYLAPQLCNLSAIQHLYIYIHIYIIISCTLWAPLHIEFECYPAPVYAHHQLYTLSLSAIQHLVIYIIHRSHGCFLAPGCVNFECSTTCIIYHQPGVLSSTCSMLESHS